MDVGNGVGVSSAKVGAAVAVLAVLDVWAVTVSGVSVVANSVMDSGVAF